MPTLGDQNEQFYSLKSPNEIWVVFDLKNSVCDCTFKLKLHIHDLQKTVSKKKNAKQKKHITPQPTA